MRTKSLVRDWTDVLTGAFIDTTIFHLVSYKEKASFPPLLLGTGNEMKKQKGKPLAR